MYINKDSIDNRELHYNVCILIKIVQITENICTSMYIIIKTLVSNQKCMYINKDSKCACHAAIR